MGEERTITLAGDEYCLIELLPRGAWDDVQSEMRAIEDYVASHKGECGWTDAFKLLGAGGGGLEGTGMTIGELGRAVGEHLAAFTAVAAPEGPAWSSTAAWGDKSCVVFADHDETERVQHVWLRLGLRTPGQVQAMRFALDAIAERWALLLADWRWCCVVDLREPERLGEYLEMRRSG